MKDDGSFYFTSETAFLAYGEDNLSGTKHIYFSLNNSGYEDIVNGDFLRLTGKSDGEYYGKGYLVDYVGNASDVISGYGYLDNTAPSVQIIIDPKPVTIGGTVYTDPKSSFSIEAVDRLSGVKGIYVSLNGSDFVRYELETSIPIRGNLNLRVYAVDNLGNKSETTQMNFANNLKLPESNIFFDID